MKAIRVFDLKQVLLFNITNELLAHIPGLNSRTLLNEFAAYKQAAPETLPDSHVVDFWLSNKTRWPQLSVLALRYLSIPTNSVDAERSVSHHTMVNTPQ